MPDALANHRLPLKVACSYSNMGCANWLLVYGRGVAQISRQDEKPSREIS